MTTPSAIENIFLAALEKGAPEEQAAYLDRVCQDDPELRRLVERLLRAHPHAGGFLEEPAAGPVAETTGAFVPAGGEAREVIAGRYKLLESLGEGGMGSVWVAEQTQPVRRKVALKLIKAGMDSKTVLSRFEAERQALALMDHPNIAKVLDGGTTESGRPFFVMEYVKGVPLTRYCDGARLSIAARLALFVPICQAVQHAHQKGIIHRDLKPSNILVCLYDGKPVPKVIDFGLAKAMHQPLTEHTLHTAHGVMMGTPLYMSPEQAEFNNLDVDTRTDIYALGVILYELLTGTTPLQKQRFKEAAWHEMLRLIKEEEPPRPSVRLSSSQSLPSVAAQRQLEPVKLARLVRGELDWIVMKCLEKERSRRYDTAFGLARDVERYLADEVVEAQPPSAGYRLRKFVRRNNGRILAAGLGAAMLMIVLGLVLYGLWWADRQSAERRHEQALASARKDEMLKATLDQIETALQSARLAEAGTLVAQAEGQIEEQTTADLRERHARLQKDEATVRELNDIFEERWMVSPSDTRMDTQRAKRRYPALFQKCGLAVGQTSAAEIIEKVHGSMIADALASALTEWFFVDPKYPGLLAVVDSIDPEPTRFALRGAIARDETDRIKEIAKKIDGAKLSPAYAIGLASHLDEDGGLRILKAAWPAHPDSFPLILATGSQSYMLPPGRHKVENIGWGRTAVALRPKNPLAHYFHAVWLFGSVSANDVDPDDVADALDELYRTISLAPRLAKAHARLAFILYFNHQNKVRDGDATSKAVAAARTAIELDGRNMLAQLVLYTHTVKQGDYLGASQLARQLFREAERAPVENGPEEVLPRSYVSGYLDSSIAILLKNLIAIGRPFEAYRLIVDCQLSPANFGVFWRESGYSLAARAAALAGTGQGLDAPPLTEGPAIRRHALEWLNAGLDARKRDAAELAAFGAGTFGLSGSPAADGRLLLAMPALAAGILDGVADCREIVHEEMDHWTKDPDLARIRDDQWLAKLPAEESARWRKLWSEVRALRDRTAPMKPPAKP